MKFNNTVLAAIAIGAMMMPVALGDDNKTDTDAKATAVAAATAATGAMDHMSPSDKACGYVDGASHCSLFLFPSPSRAPFSPLSLSLSLS